MSSLYDIDAADIDDTTRPLSAQAAGTFTCTALLWLLEKKILCLFRAMPNDQIHRQGRPGNQRRIELRPD